MNERIYYKAMIGIITMLMAICTFFIIGIFKKADMTYEYVIGHKVEYNIMRIDVNKIQKELKELPKFVQNYKK